MNTKYAIKHPEHLIIIARLYVENGFVYRFSVDKKYRGKGHGSQLLRNICRDADSEGINLSLISEPFGIVSLSSQDLFSFYSRYGFVRIGNTKQMIRRHLIS